MCRRWFGQHPHPFHHILPARKEVPRKIISFYGGRTHKDIYFTEEYGQLAKEMKDFTHIPAISEPAEGVEWSGEKGLITQVMDRHLKDISNCEVYMCGLPIIIEFAYKLLC